MDTVSTRRTTDQHRAAAAHRAPALTPTVLVLLDFYAALDVGADPGPFPVRSQHLARTRNVLIARGLVLADVPTGGRIVTAAGRELVARRAAVAARQAAR